MPRRLFPFPRGLGETGLSLLILSQRDILPHPYPSLKESPLLYIWFRLNLLRPSPFLFSFPPIPLKVLPNMLSCSFLLLRSRNHNIGISASKRGCEYIVLTYYLSNLRKLILKVVPFPTVDCLTNILPLWYSTIILLAKLKPNPHPLCFEEYPG